MKFVYIPRPVVYLLSMLSFSQSSCLLGAVGAGKLPGWCWEQTPTNGPSTNATFQRSSWYSLWFGAAAPPPPTGETVVTSLLFEFLEKIASQEIHINSQKAKAFLWDSCNKVSAILSRFPLLSRCWTSQKRAKTSQVTCRTLASVQIFTQRRIPRQVANPETLLPNLILGSCHCFFF